MKGICLIAGAGVLYGTLPPIGENDLVIAADAGYKALVKLGARIDRVVGDFDSLGTVPIHPSVEVHPAEKDETDMMLAVRTGLRLGYRRFFIYGGLGGRLDHSYANLQTLLYIARRNAEGWLFGDHLAITAIVNRALRFSDQASGTVSVFSADGNARGVNLEGLKYPLVNHTLTVDDPLGVSNEFTGKPSRIEVKEGAVLIMAPEGAPGWLIPSPSNP